MIVLGIDPGSRHTGYGVIRAERGQEELIEYGVLHLDATKDHHWRLRHLFERLSSVVERCLPDECAVEMPVYGRNPQSMLKLGRAQAAAILTALTRDIPVQEYTPKEVKRAVTGNGNASKEQVWYMVKAILKIDETNPEHGTLGLDASDALAVALCHVHRGAGGGPKRYSGWDAFLKANPGRIR